MVVRINPFGSLSPGMTNLAITPAMKPMMIVQIMPISHSFPGWSGTNFPSSTIRDAAGYVRNNLEVAAGTVRLIYVNAGSRLGPPRCCHGLDCCNLARGRSTTNWTRAYAWHARNWYGGGFQLPENHHHSCAVRRFR